MKILYIEPFCGVAGDMLNAALLGLEGAPSLGELIRVVSSLGFSEKWNIELSKVTRHSINANYFNVCVERDSENHTHGRTLGDIVKLIDNAECLSDYVKCKSIEVFNILAEAEAKVHGTTTNLVHFHEVGALDAIVDIVSSCFILEKIAPDRIYSSEIALGSGSVVSAHGNLPVPVPATLNLVKNIPVVFTDIKSELATPTGCALLSSFVDEWKKPSSATIVSSSYGAGTRNLDERPSVLRVSMMNSLVANANSSFDSDTVAVIETNVDDMTPEALGAFQERLFKLGILDCSVSSVFMKKQRPAFFIKIITEKDRFLKIANILLSETSTLGLRYRFENRLILNREITTVPTPFGEVDIKLSYDRSRSVKKFKIEYNSCLDVAKMHDMSFWEMHGRINAFLNVEKE